MIRVLVGCALSLMLASGCSIGGSSGGQDPAADSVSTRRHCADAPHRCGFPDATNTGVEAGVTLRTVRGSVHLDKQGTVFANAVVHGSIDVMADDVTIRNVRILNDGEGWGIGLHHTKNATVSNVEILPTQRLLVGSRTSTATPRAPRSPAGDHPDHDRGADP